MGQFHTRTKPRSVSYSHDLLFIKIQLEFQNGPEMPLMVLGLETQWMWKMTG